MSSRVSTKRNQAIAEVTNDLLKSRFTTEVGQKATIERSTIENDRMDALRAVIADVGKDLVETGTIPKGMEYVGSLSIHVYKSEILRTAAFATVSNHDRMTFDLADAALRELTGATMISYGGSRRKLRSGF